MKDLTIILTLKGRHAFTHRWLSFMGESQFEGRVIVADGEDDGIVSTMLKNNRYDDLILILGNFQIRIGVTIIKKYTTA